MKLYPLLLLITILPCASWAQPDDGGALFFSPRLEAEFALSDGNIGPLLQELGTDPLEVPIREKRITCPLLPVIFFDPGSPSIPQRYQTFYSTRETDSYADTMSIRDVDDFGNPAREKYRQILNVLGYRMANNPRTAIALEPSYSTDPGENADVARRRAEVVRDYLTYIWHVEPERIVLLPPIRACDSSAGILAQEEARRVTIRTNDWALIAPICVPVHEVKVGVMAMAASIIPNLAPGQVASVEIIVSLDDRRLGRITLEGHPDSTVYRIVGVLPAFGLIHEPVEKINMQAIVTARDGRVRSTEVVSAPIVERIADGYQECSAGDTEFRIPYFVRDATSIDEVQRTHIDEFVKRSLAELDYVPENVAIDADVGFDVTELPGFSGEMSDSFQTPYSFLINEVFGPLLVRDREFPITLVSSTERLDEEELIDVWVGEGAAERMEELFGDLDESDYYDVIGRFAEEGGGDTVVRALISKRGETIVQSLLAGFGIPPDSADIEIEAEEDGLLFGVPSTPEERYLLRGTRVRVAFRSDDEEPSWPEVYEMPSAEPPPSEMPAYEDEE